MYRIGELIVKANIGVCRVVDFLQPNLDIRGIDKNKWYYQLIPIEEEKTKIYIAADEVHIDIRKIMTMEEAAERIEQISALEVLQFADERMREQTYKKIIKENDPKELLRMLKTIYLRKQEREAQGKKNTTVDENYSKLAERFLFSELCVVLKKSREEIYECIWTSLNEKND